MVYKTNSLFDSAPTINFQNNKLEISNAANLGVDDSWKITTPTGDIKFQCYFKTGYEQVDPTSFKGFSKGSANIVTFRPCYFENELAQYVK